MVMIKIQDEAFVRDVDSMGLSNINYKEREEYYEKVRLLKKQKEEINSVKEEINSVKEEVSEIKSILLKILENTNKS